MAKSKFKCPQVIAHRGASYYAPENTKAAFELAAKQGAKWIEVDLQLTRDNNLAIIHNSTVTKCTDGQGKVIKMDYAEIAKLDAGSWFSEKYVGQRVLSLEKFIKLITRLNLNVNLEIKALSAFNVKTAEVAVNLINKHWPTNKTLPLISSSSADALYTVKSLSPNLPRALVTDEWNRSIQKTLVDLGCVSVSVNKRIITNKTLNSMHDCGCAVIAYTVNNLKTAVNFIEMGVDALFTDRPLDIIKVLEENNLYKEKS